MEKIIKKVAAIHDLSGFGRSSLTNIIPILSTMGIQVCPLQQLFYQLIQEDLQTLVL